MLWGLLFIAVAVILFIAVVRLRKGSSRFQSRFSSDYFKGLNYLLNEEQDKALDIFLKLVEQDWETIDTHFALAGIYRKNGEIDKAIKVHQNLIARPSLPAAYKTRVLIELGRDYLVAGWLDRAESLFREVLRIDKKSSEARQYLIQIFQQEKEWQSAIEIAADLYRDDPATIGPAIAQFYCEQSSHFMDKGESNSAEQSAKNALGYDKKCIRALMILARIQTGQSKYKKARGFIENIIRQDHSYFPEVIDELIECHRHTNSLQDLGNYLVGLAKKHPDIETTDALVTVLGETKGRDAALEYLSESMKKRPSLKAVMRLLAMKKTGQEFDVPEELCEIIENSVRQVDEQRADFLCNHCGFQANTLYWLCPGCHSWGSIKPVGAFRPGSEAS